MPAFPYMSTISVLVPSVLWQIAKVPLLPSQEAAGSVFLTVLSSLLKSQWSFFCYQNCYVWSGCKNLNTPPSPKPPTPKRKPEKRNQNDFEWSWILLNDFSCRPHVRDNECFLLYTPISSGRSSIIWVTNSSNLFGAEACEIVTSCTQWFNTVWTICHVLAKAGAEPWSPTDLCLVLFLIGIDTAAQGFLESHFSVFKEATNHGTYLPSAEDEKVLYEL